jgi:hypothetical protein
MRSSIPEGPGERGRTARRPGRTVHRCRVESFEEIEMADVICVVLVVATFAVLALVVKGVERLER